MKIIHEHQIWGFRGLPNFGQTHDASDIPSERRSDVVPRKLFSTRSSPSAGQDVAKEEDR